MDIPIEVFKAYQLDPAEITVAPLGNGLINKTYRLTGKDTEYVLQRINDLVFPDPASIAHNMEVIQEFLNEKHPDYFFVAPVRSMTGNSITNADGHFYRLFHYVKNSHSLQVVENRKQAFQAARQFGSFTRMLNGLDVNRLQITLEDFHDLSMRFSQFAEIEKIADEQRLLKASEAIQAIYIHAEIVAVFNKIKESNQFILRATHHDTKISNVLFNANDEAICVIDFDTLMPGYFISDVGDMMRTYLCPVSEEETNLDKIKINPEYFQAIMEGYLGEMKGILTNEEKRHFAYSGKFMIYMQALRFLTDYLNNDMYYGASYETHNLQRALNQLRLLEKYTELEDRFEERVELFLGNE